MPDLMLIGVVHLTAYIAKLPTPGLVTGVGARQAFEAESVTSRPTGLD